MTKISIVCLALCTILGCASAPPPPPIEPVPAEPAGAAPNEGPTAPPPVASEPPMATAPPVGAATTPQTTASTSPGDRHPAVDPSRPRGGPAPASARSTATSTGSTAASTPAYTGPDPCKLAVDGDSPVDKACREGGLKSAKTTMKAMLKDARAAGVRFDCDDCHINEEDYAQLSQGTDEKFAKLLAAGRK